MSQNEVIQRVPIEGFTSRGTLPDTIDLRDGSPLLEPAPVVQEAGPIAASEAPAAATTIGSVSTLHELEAALEPVAGRSCAYRASKRAVDIVGASVLLLLTLPLTVALWIVVRLDSRGPALFRQTRVGQRGRPFRFYKFRTMYVDARERFPELYAYRYDADGVRELMFKLPHDPRHTRFGRLLRRTSLDELPNLVNVLRGDMSLVGPRPEIPEMVRYYRDDQLRKFVVKPGLTGSAQVSGRNILTFQQTIARDLWYVDHQSLWSDAKILVKTPIVVMGMLGAL